jgi:cytochrome c oxidase assembly factor CtaG
VLGTAAATPGFWDWAFDPPLVLVIDLAILYAIGARRTVTPARKRGAQRWRAACFYLSLFVLAVALASPIERLSADLFWVHMIQHVLLIVVAAPLFVIAAPWIRLWRCLPLDTRRWLARGLSHGERTAPLRALSRALGRPVPSFVVFSVVLLGWHVPALFDATLESTTPLAVVLALAPHPLYSYYAHLSSRPGGISAMADQQLAAGIMWVPGSVTFLIVLFVYVHRWLLPPSPDGARPQRLASEH